jgi:hypothetical protein
VLSMAVVGDPGDEVTARTDGGARPQPDTTEMLAVPMQAVTRAVRTAVAIPELNIFLQGPSINRLVYKLAPAADAKPHSSEGILAP